MLPPDDVIRAKVKAELRKRMRALRKTTPSSVLARHSEAIREHLAKAPWFGPALGPTKRVALFWPIEERDEVDLRPLDAWLRERGVLVHYPRVDRESNRLVFHLVGDVATMQRSDYGILEPPAHSASVHEPNALDLVVVPALAVDASGQRLGYGAGYYDRALSEFPSTLRVCVAYQFQFVAELPHLPHDEPVDWVVTESGPRRAAPARANVRES